MAKVGIGAAERALIKGCAEQGVGIDDLGNGSTFRFVPFERAVAETDYAKPSGRGSTAAPCQPWARKLKNWKPPRLSLDPMYKVPMTGDDAALTRARFLYAQGYPAQLREWLARQR